MLCNCLCNAEYSILLIVVLEYLLSISNLLISVNKVYMRETEDIIFENSVTHHRISTTDQT